MPYKKVVDLPESVKNHLPSHAQKVYMEAFNHAFEEYANPSNRRDDSSLEETSHKVAWSAVKNTYHKNEKGKWVKKT
jgi:cation transport regulator